MCTSLVPVIGYDKAAEIAYQAYNEKKTIREVVLDHDILSEDEVNILLDHRNMVKSQK